MFFFVVVFRMTAIKFESTVNHFSSWKCFGMTQYNHVFIFVCVCVCRGLEQSVRVLHVGNVTITPTRVEQINMKLALFLVCICIAQDVFMFVNI